MDVLALFTIDGAVKSDATSVSSAFVAIKTWNVERYARRAHPGTVEPDDPDNAAIAGPQSVYDLYV